MSVAYGATFTINAEVANAITVNVQLTERNGDPIANKVEAEFYLTSDSAGNTPINAVTTGIVPTAGTDGALIDLAITGTQGRFVLVSEDDGDIDIVFTNSGDETETVYLHYVRPDNKLVNSGAIAFVDNTP